MGSASRGKGEGKGENSIDEGGIGEGGIGEGGINEAYLIAIRNRKNNSTPTDTTQGAVKM